MDYRCGETRQAETYPQTDHAPRDYWSRMVGSVAHSPEGQWIYKFEYDGSKLKSTMLVNMKNHDCKLETIIHFSPDQRWVIFRANFEGTENIYALILLGRLPAKKITFVFSVYDHFALSLQKNWRYAKIHHTFCHTVHCLIHLMHHRLQAI